MAGADASCVPGCACRSLPRLGNREFVVAGKTEDNDGRVMMTVDKALPPLPPPPLPHLIAYHKPAL